LTVTFEKVKGYINMIQEKAKNVHIGRLKTQPEPTNNLGSIFKRDEATTLGMWISRIGRLVSILFHIPSNNRSILKLKLFLLGYKELGKYLFDLNRFIWIDSNAHKAFNQYLLLRKKLYKNNEFEIEIFK